MHEYINFYQLYGVYIQNRYAPHLRKYTMDQCVFYKVSRDIWIMSIHLYVSSRLFFLANRNIFKSVAWLVIQLIIICRNGKKVGNHCYRDYINTGYCVEVARYIFYLNNLTNVIKLLKYNNYRARSLWCKIWNAKETLKYIKIPNKYYNNWRRSMVTVATKNHTN